MSISIIDNFRLNSAKPIDDRTVVGDGNRYQSKESIELKYIGLRVWDINESKTFVWNGNSWILDSGSSGSSGVNGTTNYIPKFNSSSTISNSIIYELGGRIGINKTNPSSELDVNGDITAININANIRAERITSGSLPLSRLSGGGNNTLLVGTSGAAQWQSIDQVLGNYSGSSLPVGAIILWSSDILPTGFVLCDGSQYTVNSQSVVTPDLSGSFIKASTDGVSDLGQQGQIDIIGSGKSYVLNYIMYVGTIDNIREETTTTTEEITTTINVDNVVYGGSDSFTSENICGVYNNKTYQISIEQDVNSIQVNSTITNQNGQNLSDGFYSYFVNGRPSYFRLVGGTVLEIQDCGGDNTTTTTIKASNLIYGGSDSFTPENICDAYNNPLYQIPIQQDVNNIELGSSLIGQNTQPVADGLYSYFTTKTFYLVINNGAVSLIRACGETTTTTTKLVEETTTTTERVEETTTTTELVEETTTTRQPEETTTTTELVEETTTTSTTTTTMQRQTTITLYGPWSNSQEACSNNLSGPSIQINNVVFNIGVILNNNLDSNEIITGYYTYGGNGEYINYQSGGGIQEINSCS